MVNILLLELIVILGAVGIILVSVVALLTSELYRLTIKAKKSSSKSSKTHK